MTEQTNTENPVEMTFEIQRIYTKDISFESPNSPRIFSVEWKPEIKMEMDTSSTVLSEHVVEVCLRITVTATLGEEVAFLCEVKQAGIFTVMGLDDNQMAHCVGAYCPNILFPYARECISNLVNRGTFQPINLAPVNFDALFMNYLQQQAEQAQAHQDA